MDFEIIGEPRKLYQVLEDGVAQSNGQIRIVDESGEDYLFPDRLFLHLSLPTKVVDELERVAP